MATKLPIVMPANLRKLALGLNEQFPGRLGCLFSPGSWTHPRGLPYALDNGRFSVWSKKLEWDEAKFDALLERARGSGENPLWIAVPDTVANAKSTLTEWRRRYDKLKRHGWPLALVVQDGMTIKQVETLCPIPEVIFVGGTTRWKWTTLHNWTAAFPRVHLGRANTGNMLWEAHRLGVESSDGTGWYHHKQKKQLIRYLTRSHDGQGEFDFRGFMY